mgnify:CR=1 FL=1
MLAVRRLWGSRNFGGQFDAQGFHDRQSRLQGRVAVLAERAVKLLAGKPCLPCNLGHAFGQGDNSQSMQDVGSAMLFNQRWHPQWIRQFQDLATEGVLTVWENPLRLLTSQALGSVLR